MRLLVWTILFLLPIYPYVITKKIPRHEGESRSTNLVGIHLVHPLVFACISFSYA